MVLVFTDGHRETYTAESYSTEGGYHFIKEHTGKVHVVPMDKVFKVELTSAERPAFSAREILPTRPAPREEELSRWLMLQSYDYELALSRRATENRMNRGWA